MTIKIPSMCGLMLICMTIHKQIKYILIYIYIYKIYGCWLDRGQWIGIYIGWIGMVLDREGIDGNFAGYPDRPDHPDHLERP